MGFEDKADQLKGKAKEAAGEVTDNESLENEGKADQLKGGVREKLEDAGDAVKDKFNEVAGKVQDRVDGERELLRRNWIDALVTKNSGGAMTHAKLDAADDLGVTVVMVDRPPLPDGVDAVATVDDACCWVSSR